MPVVSLALLGVLTLSVVSQLALQTRRVGPGRFRLLGSRPGSAEWWSGWIILCAFAATGVAPVLDVVGAVAPFGVFDAGAWHGDGIALWTLGAAIARATQLAMGRSWRIGVDPSEHLGLVTRRPFRVMRHAIYTGLIVMLAGFALVVPNPVAWLAVALGLTGFEILVRLVEEPYLLDAHPEYRGYRRRVGRFVPLVGRVHEASTW